MSSWNTLKSTQDASINYIQTTSVPGESLEARYVRRVEDYFIVYLSSHYGCNLSCRFCHLTATKQTSTRPASLGDYSRQAREVLAGYVHQVNAGEVAQADRVHFNFMARGDALMNPNLTLSAEHLFDELHGLALEVGVLKSRFNVSTIMPREASYHNGLRSIFSNPWSVPYYSLYSVKESFRKRWLPKALPVSESLDMLADLQKYDKDRKVVLHWAFIEGENDTERDVNAILESVDKSGLRAKFNLVRYNPPSGRKEVEASEDKIQHLFNIIQGSMKLPGSRIVPRVGFDVAASCGMFVN